MQHETKRIARLGGLALLLLPLSSCGVFESKYVGYEDTDTTTGENGGTDTNAKCKEVALASFKSNIGNATDTCASSCHSSNPKLKLSKGDDDNNRSALLKFSAKDAAALFDFISSSKHLGGPQSSMPIARIEAWITEEKKCE